jgi:hypothetical protein
MSVLRRLFRFLILLNVVLLTLSTNLVINPGGETGDFTGWIPGCNWAVTTTNVHSGTRKFGVGSSSTPCPLSQNITSLVIGSDYQFSLWADSGIGGRLNVTINKRLVVSVSALPIAYAQYSAVFTATATVETLVITSNNCRVDDVFIEILSNPTSQPTTNPTVYFSDASSLKNGLVAYYPFDGNPRDETGNGNHGVMHGGVSLVPDRFGNARSAMQFDGSSGYLFVSGEKITFNVNVSISFWIYPTSNSGTLISKQQTFRIKPYQTYRFYWCAVTNTEECGYSFQTTASTWNYIAVIKQGSAMIIYSQIFSSGNLVGPNLRSYPGNSYELNNNRSAPLTFMAANAGANSISSFSQGILDDVLIFNRTLTRDEIQELFSLKAPTSAPSSQPSKQPSNQPTSQPSRHPTLQPSSQPSSQPIARPSCRPTSQPTRQPSSQPSRHPSSQPSKQPTTQPTVQPTVRISSSLRNGLVAYYPFDGDANDNSGNDNHGTIHGGVNLAFDRFGSPERSYSFDGSSGCVEVAGQQFNFASNMSISFWWKPMNLPASYVLLNKAYWNRTYSPGGWSLQQMGDSFEFDYKSNTLYQTTGHRFRCPANQWTHVAVVKEINLVKVFSEHRLEYYSTIFHLRYCFHRKLPFDDWVL